MIHAVTFLDKKIANPPRLHSLDSLRGIAAFIVVLFHCYLAWPLSIFGMPTILRFTPLRILVSGHGAVMLFFVLSGYVLAMPSSKKETPSYASFIIKRICRIYIPFIFAILVAALLFSLSNLENRTGSPWFQEQWRNTPSIWSSISNHLLMTGKSNDMWLDGVMWSLVEELRISIIFPILVVFCKRVDLGIFLSLLIFFMSTSFLYFTGNSENLINPNNLGITFVLTLRYVPFFMLGIILQNKNSEINRWLHRTSYPFLAGAFTLSCIVFCLPVEVHQGQILARLGIDQFINITMDAAWALAGGFFIIFARNISRAKTVLEVGVIRWLGKISYSLYLVHLPIVLFTFHLLMGREKFLSIVAIVICTSLAVASVFHFTVERPSMKLGRYLAEIIQRHNTKTT